MSDLDDKEDYQVHRNAWVKEHGTKRGFNSHNYKRYGFATEGGLRRHIGRRESIRRDQRGPGNNGRSRHRAVQKSSKGNSNNAASDKQIELNQIRRTRYELIPPTLHREEINTIDELVTWIQTYTPYMQGKWNNKNTREIANTLFFEVFKKGDSTLIGKPRGSGKSKISVAVYLCIMANYWYPQGVIVNGPKAKRRIFNGMARVLIHNPLFRQKYGDIVSSKSKGEGVFELHPEIIDSLYTSTGYVTDDPAIQISVYSGIIGAHPYVVWLEDILQSEFKSMESNEYLLYEVFDGIIAKLSERIGGTLTRKGMDDMYSQLPSRNILLSIRGAIELLKGRWPIESELVYDEEGRAVDLIIPENSEYKIIERPGWTIKSLLIKRTLALKDPRSFEMFEREMQNNPILSEGLYFKDCEIEMVEPFRNGELANKLYMVMDPAFGKSSGSSDTAILVIGVYQQCFWIVEVIIAKFNDTEMGDMCEDLCDIHKPLEFRAENDFEQLTKNTHLMKRLRALRGFRTFYCKGFGDKQSRIEQLHTPLINGQWKIYNTARNKNELILQKQIYNRREGKFDGLDAMASGYRLFYDKLRTKRRRGVRVV